MVNSLFRELQIMPGNCLFSTSKLECNNTMIGMITFKKFPLYNYLVKKNPMSSCWDNTILGTVVQDLLINSTVNLFL